MMSSFPPSAMEMDGNHNDNFSGNWVIQSKVEDPQHRINELEEKIRALTSQLEKKERKRKKSKKKKTDKSSPSSSSERVGHGSPEKSAKRKDSASSKNEGKDEKPGQSRYWTDEEHQRFLKALEKYGAKDVKNISREVGTRNPTQVRTHSQKYFLRLQREQKRREKEEKLKKALQVLEGQPPQSEYFDQGMMSPDPMSPNSTGSSRSTSPSPSNPNSLQMQTLGIGDPRSMLRSTKSDGQLLTGFSRGSPLATSSSNYSMGRFQAVPNTDHNNGNGNRLGGMGWYQTMDLNQPQYYSSQLCHNNSSPAAAPSPQTPPSQSITAIVSPPSPSPTSPSPMPQADPLEKYRAQPPYPLRHAHSAPSMFHPGLVNGWSKPPSAPSSPKRQVPLRRRNSNIRTPGRRNSFSEADSSIRPDEGMLTDDEYSRLLDGITASVSEENDEARCILIQKNYLPSQPLSVVRASFFTFQKTMIALGHKDTNHSGHEEVEHNAPAAVVSTNSAHFPLHNNNWDHYPVEHAAQNAQSNFPSSSNSHMFSARQSEDFVFDPSQIRSDKAEAPVVSPTNCFFGINPTAVLIRSDAPPDPNMESMDMDMSSSHGL